MQKICEINVFFFDLLPDAVLVATHTIKVNKNQNVQSEVFVCTKNEQKYFCISALASKMGQIIKTMAHYHAN